MVKSKNLWGKERRNGNQMVITSSCLFKETWNMLMKKKSAALKMQIPSFRCVWPPWWQMCEGKICLCEMVPCQRQGMHYCKHCGFAESLNQVWTWWAAAALSLFVLRISHKLWDCWEILKLMFWLDLKYPSPQLYPCLKFPAIKQLLPHRLLAFHVAQVQPFHQTTCVLITFWQFFLL